MKKQDFLNFLNSEYQTATSSLDANEPLGKISEELEANEERYSETTLIDQGGMKLINRVHDRVTDRFLVMATSKNSEDKNAQEHFLREARITASLQHPNIVPIHDIGFNSSKQPYFIMKMIDGVSFQEYLNDDHIIQEKLSIFLKVCDAIDYAHSQGIVHLDLKPVNIRVGKHGEVIVCDWGLAKVIYEDCNEEFLKKDSLDSCNLQLTLYGRGTPGYMAPEQFSKEDDLTRQSDIYSLGAILYTILTGKAPINGNDYEEIKRKTLAGNIKTPSLESPNKNIPMSVEAICLKALSTKPEERYKSVESLISEIQTYLNGFAPKAEKASFITQFKLLYFRNRSIINFAMITLILVVCGVFWFISKLKSSELETRTAFDQLQKQVTLRQEAEAEALKGAIREGWAQLKQTNLDKALDNVKLALHYSPANTDALRQAVLIHLAKFDFNKAAEYAEQFPDGQFLHLRKKISTLQDADSDKTPYILVIKEFQSETFGRLYHSLIRKIMPTLSTENKKLFAKQLIVNLNKQAALENISFSKDSKSIFVKNAKLGLMPPLDGSGIENIDISNTGLTRVFTLNTMKIKKLSLAGNPIGYLDIEPKCKSNITELNIQRTHFSHIPDKMENLVVLNISFCKIGSYERLLSMKKLQKLITNKGQLPKAVHSRLKCQIIEL